MTTISTQANSIFTSLKDTNSNASQQTGSALLDEMTGRNSVQQASKANLQSSYLLDLSPEAQAFMKTQSGDGNAATPAGKLNSNFILTGKQQQQIFEVINQFKDEPFTKETYALIENELDKLGLSPDALAIKDKARGINTTSMLLAALNGTGGDVNQSLLKTGDTTEQAQTKKDNYVKNLLAKWSDISTTIDAEEGA